MPEQLEQEDQVDLAEEVIVEPEDEVARLVDQPAAARGPLEILGGVDSEPGLHVLCPEPPVLGSTKPVRCRSLAKDVVSGFDPAWHPGVAETVESAVAR